MLVVVLLGLAGCVTPAPDSPGVRVAGTAPVPRPSPPTVSRPTPRPLTQDEIARLRGLRAAIERVRAAYRPPCLGRRCVPLLIVVEGLEPVALWDAARFRIGLRRRALAAGVEPRPALAHELAHWVLGHTDAGCAGRGFECETAANAEAVRVLVAGWTMPPEEAVTLMYTSLTAGLRRGRPLRGHEAPCEEVAEFARAFGRPPPACPGS